LCLMPWLLSSVPNNKTMKVYKTRQNDSV
jgi:hypothetical protein